MTANVQSPAAVFAALAAAGGQMVQIAPRVRATPAIAAFLRPKTKRFGGTPQCFGTIPYRPRKTQGVFLRRLPDPSR